MAGFMDGNCDSRKGGGYNWGWGPCWSSDMARSDLKRASSSRSELDCGKVAELLGSANGSGMSRVSRG